MFTNCNSSRYILAVPSNNITNCLISRKFNPFSLKRKLVSGMVTSFQFSSISEPLKYLLLIEILSVALFPSSTKFIVIGIVVILPCLVFTQKCNAQPSTISEILTAFQLFHAIPALITSQPFWVLSHFILSDDVPCFFTSVTTVNSRQASLSNPQVFLASSM